MYINEYLSKEQIAIFSQEKVFFVTFKLNDRCRNMTIQFC